MQTKNKKQLKKVGKGEKSKLETSLERRDIILVIAKDRQQFHYWLQELSPSDKNNYIYADINSIRGVRARVLIEIGNCCERKDYYELRYEALTRIF